MRKSEIWFDICPTDVYCSYFVTDTEFFLELRKLVDLLAIRKSRMRARHVIAMFSLLFSISLNDRLSVFNYSRSLVVSQDTRSSSDLTTLPGV